MNASRKRRPSGWPELAHLLGYGFVLTWGAGYALSQAGIVGSPDPLLVTAGALLIAVKRGGGE